MITQALQKTHLTSLKRLLPQKMRLPRDERHLPSLGPSSWGTDLRIPRAAYDSGNTIPSRPGPPNFKRRGPSGQNSHCFTLFYVWGLGL